MLPTSNDHVITEMNERERAIRSNHSHIASVASSSGPGPGFNDSSQTLLIPTDLQHDGEGSTLAELRALLLNMSQSNVTYDLMLPTDAVRSIPAAHQRFASVESNYHDSEAARSLFASSRSTLDVTSYGSSQNLLSTALDTSEKKSSVTRHQGAVPLILISISLCLAVICLALDNTIIATAIPKITDTFGAGSIRDIGWFGSAYLLTTSAFQLLFGRLYTFFSLKLVYLCALAFFEGGSLICGLAPNATVFILGRAIAGIGCAGVYTGSYLIIESTIPRTTRPTFTGFIGASYAVASVCGPILGGVFSEMLTWRWCFYINLPIGALTAIVLLFVFHPKPPVQTMRDLPWKTMILQFDPLGTILLIGSVTTLLIALQDGGVVYAWSSPVIIVLLVLSAIFACAFAFTQFRQGDNATIPVRLLKYRTVSASCFYAAMLGGTYFICAYYVPIWFQMVKGKSPVDAGVMSIYMIISEVILSIATGLIVSKYGYFAPFILISSILMPIGAGLLSTLQPDTKLGIIVVFELVLGAGIGSGSQHIQTAIQTVLSKKDIPSGTALATFAQSLGGSIFLSAAQTIFMNRLTSNLNMADLHGLSGGMLDSLQHVSKQLLPQVQHAYNTALHGAFYIAAGLAAASIIGASFVEWKSIKVRAMEDEESEKN